MSKTKMNKILFTSLLLLLTNFCFGYKSEPEKEFNEIRSSAELDSYLKDIEKKYQSDPNNEELMFKYGRALTEKANILYFKYLE